MKPSFRAGLGLASRWSFWVSFCLRGGACAWWWFPVFGCTFHLKGIPCEREPSSILHTNTSVPLQGKSRWGTPSIDRRPLVPSPSRESAALCVPPCADFLAGAALCEPPCADVVVGAALCEPPCADFVAGTALCAPPCADVVAGAIQNA